MSERDQRWQLTVGAEASPLDPDGQPQRPDPAPEVDVVQAVAALVDDLVDDPGDAGDPGHPGAADASDGAVDDVRGRGSGGP
jgi:hypothetical protein